MCSLIYIAIGRKHTGKKQTLVFFCMFLIVVKILGILVDFRPDVVGVTVCLG